MSVRLERPKELRATSSGRGPLFVLAGLLVLPLLDVGLFGFSRVFQYLAADVFYYLTVAINFPTAGYFTFDQRLPTDGFHPLWQSILAAAAFPVSASSNGRSLLIWVAFLLSYLLLCAGILLVAARAYSELAPAGALIALLPVGATLPFLGPYGLRNSMIWQFANGMESGLTIFFFGLFVFLVLGEKRLTDRGWILRGLVIGLLIYGRLDAVFIIPALALACMLEAWRGKREGKPGEVLGSYFKSLALAGLLVCAYVVADYVFTGELLPVSSRMKSSFPAVKWSNLERLPSLWKMFLHPSRDTADFARRAIYVVVPMLVGVFEVVRQLVGMFRGTLRPGSWSRVLAASAFYLIFVNAYDLVYVSFLAQWTWYYALSYVAANLIMIQWLASFRPLQRVWSARIEVLVLLLAFTLGLSAFASSYLALKPVSSDPADQQSYQARNYLTFQEGVRLRNFYGNQPPKVVEFDDGIIAYSSGFPTMSGFGYCLDDEAANRLLKEDMASLLPLAFERGFDRIASSQYMRLPVIYAGAPDSVVTAFLQRWRWVEDFSPFRFKVEYVSPNG